MTLKIHLAFPWLNAAELKAWRCYTSLAGQVHYVTSEASLEVEQQAIIHK